MLFGRLRLLTWGLGFGNSLQICMFYTYDCGLRVGLRVCIVLCVAFWFCWLLVQLLMLSLVLGGLMLVFVVFLFFWCCIQDSLGWFLGCLVLVAWVVVLSV